MDYEQAKELFYNDEEIQKQFNFWDIDYALSKIDIFLSDMEDIMKERGE